MQSLKLKIIEETNEFIENPCLEEAADMLEVLKAFFDINDFDFNVVDNTASEKAKERGGFTEGIILEKVIHEHR